jgi:hypothetical protein
MKEDPMRHRFVPRLDGLEGKLLLSASGGQDPVTPAPPVSFDPTDPGQTAPPAPPGSGSFIAPPDPGPTPDPGLC